ncbi:MAG: hypothetical protein WA747_04570 [Steroidobacteraceae bacterium]
MKRLVTAVSVVCIAAAVAGCHREPGRAASERTTPLPREWPQGRGAPVKITDQLSLAVPLQYERSAIEPGGPPAPPASQSGHGEVQFDFFLPDFSGYTLQNYRNDSDPNRVEVVYLHAGDAHEGDPDAPGEYPPNMLKRALQQAFDPRRYHDQYGLRCYEGRELAGRIACYGQRDKKSREDIMLTSLVPPYPEGVTFPVFQARYFSKRYGGVRLEWRAHVSQLPHWREIDAQIWKFIDAWNVVQQPGPPASAGR